MLARSLWLVLIVAGEKADDGDLEKMQGTWVVESLTTGGKPVHAAALKDASFIVDKNKYSYKGDENYRGTFSLQPGTSPKRIDSTFVDQDDTETGVARGIYKFDGKQLTICWAEMGSKKPPSEFASKSSAGHRLIVLKKAPQK